MNLCIALDASTEQNLKLANDLKSFLNKKEIWLKVGLKSYIENGAEILEKIRAIDSRYKIFLDLKLYDIPNTMLEAFKVCDGLGVDMLTIHTSAGPRAMELLSKHNKNGMLLMGVTALTSFSADEFAKIYAQNLEVFVKNMAVLAQDCGLNGLVCSVFESALIKNATDGKLLTLTPGIRPFGEEASDQARVADIKTARTNGSDFIVIGRPIYEASEPVSAVAAVLKEMNDLRFYY